MIRKVRHLVCVLIELRELSSRRFNALGGYARNPATVQFIEEMEWHATGDERLLGMLVRDLNDNDFGWIILGRDERLRFRAIDVNSSLPSLDIARDELFQRMEEHYAQPDEAFHQGDAEGPATDFFIALVPGARLHPTFRTLSSAPRYSPAHEVINAMMRFYEDTDGNFIEQFQTTAFDARLWELYLFAAFAELGYAPAPNLVIPDFIFWGPQGAVGIEATSVNPREDGEAEPLPTTSEEMLAYIENYIPIRLARVLKRKLNKQNPYWEKPEMQGVPFVVAVQDFHLPGAMRWISAAMSDYVFGVRQSRDDERRFERIEEHVWKKPREKSGFFSLPKAENISAIIVNSKGTLPKFNRVGYIAEFGDRRVCMVRSGAAFGERGPEEFVRIVNARNYSESWVEGMTVFHNPKALIPLPPEMIPGARHQFLQPDDSIVGQVPEFHPLYSHTQIWIGPRRRRGWLAAQKLRGQASRAARH
jgi:hypothetical protein